MIKSLMAAGYSVYFWCVWHLLHGLAVILHFRSPFFFMTLLLQSSELQSKTVSPDSCILDSERLCTACSISLESARVTVVALDNHESKTWERCEYSTDPVMFLSCRWCSVLVYTTATSTARAPFAWTSWRITGAQLWPFPKCCSPSVLC